MSYKELPIFKSNCPYSVFGEDRRGVPQSRPLQKAIYGSKQGKGSLQREGCSFEFHEVKVRKFTAYASYPSLSILYSLKPLILICLATRNYLVSPVNRYTFSVVIM
ncbi:hypothetical protein KIL84_019852 [Mauremys mutica]|uniref:Uncharacterized protein n=1 Tax=Mauremys mutica TaxID=74926 RepID=A0A9D3XXC9_9SAUR|nr:hypothetical protein KIL84_019852 [Mauremys mutica]